METRNKQTEQDRSKSVSPSPIRRFSDSLSGSGDTPKAAGGNSPGCSDACPHASESPPPDVDIRRYNKSLPPVSDLLADRIHCGIAGWSYPDWDGYVYPRGTKDKLGYISAYVDMIELNNTFYRPPEDRMVQSWVKKTADLPGFFFTAKLHQDITHKGVIEKPMVEAFHRGLEPMSRNDKLKHLLAQFRYDFAYTTEARKHLTAINKNFGDITNLTLELRHNSWQSPDAMEFLMSLGMGVANLDYPLAKNSFNLWNCNIGEHAYLRLHGRNAAAWFSKHAGRDETYNYCYSEDEIGKIVNRALAIAKMSKSLTIVANNHYQGKEAVNILQIKSSITGKKLPVPPLLVEKYPQLAKIRKPESSGETPR